ncbi:MAG: thiol:disulfide interchange protein DsbG [Gammaproteobacteria bacterium]
MKRITLTLLILFLLPAYSFAIEDDTSKAQKLVQTITKDQLSIVKEFPGPDNLQGFVLKPKVGTPIIMFADKEGKYAIFGNVFNPNGNSITSQAHDKYVQPLIAKTIFNNLPKTTQFLQGNNDAKYKMVVVADPNCIACHMLYDAMQTHIQKGELQVKWVLVDYVKPSSPGKAAAILTAKDPAKAMADNEAGYQAKTEEGGIKPLNPIPEEIKKQLKANMQFFSESGLNATPTIIYKDQNGQYQFISGVPRDVSVFLQKVRPNI